LTLSRPLTLTLLPYTTPSDLLVDDAQHIETGDFAGVLGRLPLRVIEVRRDGDHRLLDLIAEVVLSGLKAVITVPAYFNDSQRQRSEEHTSELQSRGHLVCRPL